MGQLPQGDVDRLHVCTPFTTGRSCDGSTGLTRVIILVMELNFCLAAGGQSSWRHTAKWPPAASFTQFFRLLASEWL